MKDRIEFLMDNYLNDKSKLIDSEKDYYIKFVKEIPEFLYNIFDKDDYNIKASVGTGQKSEIPWVLISNKSVTKSAKYGIYICFLIKSDMSGFYLTLCQGITTFEELYGKDKYINISKVSNYFRNLIDSNKFTSYDIDLKCSNKLGKGYEYGTVISKYYKSNDYDEIELIGDLNVLKGIYDDICENLTESSYMNIVENVVHNMEPDFIIAEEANKMIEKALLDANEVDEAEIITLEKVNIPNSEIKNKYSKINKKIVKKIDYEKKAKNNAKNGLLGENLVLEYEKCRLIEIGREDLASQIKWVSKEDDSYGYDILSFDVNDKNEVLDKYIEVKTTEGNSNNVFYISSNEVSVMEKLKEKYFIYRVYNVNSKKPQVFVLNYDDFKNKIELTVNDYVASLKME